MSNLTPSNSPGDPGPLSQRPCVLVVDDDKACLDEYSSTLDELNFPFRALQNPEFALEVILGDPSIGIVLTDIRMPNMSGIELIGKIREKITDGRFIVPIVITGYADLELAVAAMRFDAVDFLRKPVSRSEFSDALARAESTWSNRNRSLKFDNLSSLSSEVTRLIAQIDQVRQPAAEPTEEVSDAKVKQTVQNLILGRQKRAEYLPSELFSDPVWDILLDLTVAYVDGRPIPVSSACIASGAPISTALRRIRELTDIGMIKRWQDPDDARRDMVSLTEESMAKMRAYTLDLLRRGEEAARR